MLRSALVAPLLVIATLFSAPVAATSFSTDQSDVWNAIGEPGWAIQLVQRGSTIFATMYVYGPSTQATFYSAALEATATQFTWSGDLIATTGPWFGTTPFNSALVTTRNVGTMTWTATSTSTGILKYSVDGVFVTKTMARYLVRYDDYSGTYLAAIHEDTTECFNPADNDSLDGSLDLTVGQSGLSMTIGLAGPGATCTFTGTLSQAGQFGSVAGTYSCTSGDFGTFQFFEMNVGVNYLTGNLSTHGTNDGCNSTGYFSAVRHRP
jgi:hypothetical protein